MSGDAHLPLDKAQAEWMAKMERRLAALEGASSMQATAQRGGEFKLMDAAGGHSLLRFGTFTDAVAGIPNPKYGVMGKSGGAVGHEAVSLYWTDEDEGLAYPHEQLAWQVPTAQTITSGTFVNVAEAELFMPQGDVIFATGAIICAVGTTAEVRIAQSNGPGEVTTPVAIPSGANSIVQFSWLHPFSVGWGDQSTTNYFPFIQWQVRRTSGAGNVTAYPPRSLIVAAQRFFPQATAAGGGILFA